MPTAGSAEFRSPRKSSRVRSVVLLIGARLRGGKLVESTR